MARQRMDDLYVEMIGDNKKYVRMLRNSVTETKKAVRQINAELAKIKDPGAGLSSYGGGIGGGRMPRGKGRGKGKLPKGAGKGALGIAAGGLGAQGLSMRGLGGMGGIGQSAAALQELLFAVKQLGLINPATIVATIGVIGSYLAYRFSPWTREAAKEVEQLKASLEGLPERLQQHAGIRTFESNFIADGPAAKVADIENQLHNATFGFENATNAAEDFRLEIAKMEGNMSSKDALVGWFFDSHAIETDKVLMEEAKIRAKEYGDQVDELTRKLRLAKKEQEEYNRRLDAIPEDYITKMHKQLDDAWVTETMKMAGASDPEIQRALQLRTLEEDLAKVGRQLTDEQREAIRLAGEELSIIEQRAEARKEEQRISAENAKLVARQREEEEKARLRFNEDIAQRSFRLLQGDRSPMQVLKDDIKEIRYLIDQGGLTRAEGRSLINNRIKSMAESFGTSDRSAGAAIRGDSVEGYSLTKFGQHQRTSAEDLRSMLKELVNQGRTLDDIREGVASHGPPIEPPKKATI